jgi:hypothetical protein
MSHELLVRTDLNRAKDLTNAEGDIAVLGGSVIATLKAIL